MPYHRDTSGHDLAVFLWKRGGLPLEVLAPPATPHPLQNSPNPTS